MATNRRLRSGKWQRIGDSGVVSAEENMRTLLSCFTIHGYICNFCFLFKNCGKLTFLKLATIFPDLLLSWRS